MLDIILNSKKTKYVVLDKILKPNVKPGTTNINFFIDINSVLKTLYNPKTMEIFASLHIDEKYLISSELLNFAAHYRHYCYSRIGIYSTFYFYYTSKECNSLKKIDPNFKKTHYDKYISLNNPVTKGINGNISRNITLSSKIAEYIPNVYFIDSKFEDPNVIPYHFISNNNEETDMFLILTNDEVQYQNTLFHEDCKIMTIHGDDSKVFGSDEIYDHIISKSKKEINNILVPDFYRYLLAISGVKKYDIEGWKKFGYLRTLENLNKWHRSGLFSNINYDDENMFAETLNVSQEEKDILIKNFNLLDIKTIYYNISAKNKLELFDHSIYNFVDAKSLRYINDVYYQKYPILLEYIVEGEEYN